MILFVFEGERREPYIFNTLKKMYWSEEEIVVTAYGCNIYALYKEMQSLGDEADIVDILRNKYKDKENDPFKEVHRSDSFSEIYLIFDYDFQDVKKSVSDLNSRLTFMLSYFDEETEHGKLYINYPMVEAIRYTKALPDDNYWKYCVSREECRCFKRKVNEFSDYPNADFLVRGDFAKLMDVWDQLKLQNVSKANFICNGKNEYPSVYSESLSQLNILSSQIGKYESLPDCRVSVLAAFPILLYDWLGK